MLVTIDALKAAVITNKAVESDLAFRKKSLKSSKSATFLER
jgi:hypothetical protein